MINISFWKFRLGRCERVVVCDYSDGRDTANQNQKAVGMPKIAVRQINLTGTTGTAIFDGG